MSQGNMNLAYETADTGQMQPIPDEAGGLYVTGPIAGIGAAKMTFLVDQVVNQHGELPRKSGHKFNARDITVPVAMSASDGLLVLQTQRLLSSALNPFRGTGKLHIARDGDATPRYALCRYASGLEVAEHSLVDWGDAWASCVLSFHCFDPFFYDSNPQTVTWGATGTSSVPFFPLFASPSNVGPHFGTSSIFAQQDVGNAGDMPTNPQWIINGPMASPIIQNATTGEKMDFSANGGLNMVGGDTLVIDTTPGVLTVLLNGTNVFPYLTPDSALFQLQVGSNMIMVTAGSIADTSLVTISYRRRYLSA